MRDKLFNLETERYVLGALLKHKDSINDLIFKINKEWFASTSHTHIFEGMTSLVKSSGTISHISLLEYFHNLGIKQFDEVPVEEYLRTLSVIFDLNIDNFDNYIESLKKYYIARKAFDSSRSLQKKLTETLNDPIEDIINLVQSGLSDIVTSEVADSSNTTDLFGQMENILEEEEIKEGIIPPFEIYFKRYGGFLPGNCYGFVAGFGDGKSTFLDYIAKKCVQMKQNNCRVLYLDTELTPRQNMHRFMAALTGENEDVFRKKTWKENPVLVEKVNKYIKHFKKYKDRYHYETVENCSANELISIIRKWKNTYVKDGEIPMIVYDYMKITGEPVENAWVEYNLLGEKTNALHQLSRELNAVVIFAAQTNQDGRIASSNRIMWFASNVYHLRSKTPEEMEEHGEEFGTHILEDWKTRQQGEDAVGFRKYIKIPSNEKGKKYEYKKDFLNYNFDNFRVQEMGTYKDILDKEAEKLELAE